jgi:hypothetical protein
VQMELEQIRIRDLLLLSGQKLENQSMNPRLTGKINVHLTPADDVGEAKIDLKITSLFPSSPSSQPPSVAMTSVSEDSVMLKGAWGYTGTYPQH